MNGKDLFEAMNHVDERFVEEAENRTLPKTIPWIKLGSMAACLCLILFGLYHLQPYLRNSTEGSAAEDMITEGKYESVSPEDAPIGEIPNTILYVEEMTADGFIATVTDLGVTYVLGLGTQWNVVIQGDSRPESATAHDSRADYTGCYVLIQFYELDRETGTIVVEDLQIMEKG